MSILNYIPIWGCKHMFSAKFKEICCKFAENKIFEISEKSAKML